MLWLSNEISSQFSLWRYIFKFHFMLFYWALIDFFLLHCHHLIWLIWFIFRTLQRKGRKRNLITYEVWAHQLVTHRARFCLCQATPLPLDLYLAHVRTVSVKNLFLASEIRICKFALNDFRGIRQLISLGSGTYLDLVRTINLLPCQTADWQLSLADLKFYTVTFPMD